MDLEQISETAFQSRHLVQVAATIAETDDPFTVTEMTRSSGAPQSSVERVVKRLASAGLLVRTGTLYDKPPTIPRAFWQGFLELRDALHTASRRRGARSSGV